MVWPTVARGWKVTKSLTSVDKGEWGVLSEVYVVSWVESDGIFIDLVLLHAIYYSADVQKMPSRVLRRLVTLYKTVVWNTLWIKKHTKIIFVISSTKVDIGIMSVRPSVCLSLRNAPLLDEYGLTYRNSVIVFSLYGSPIILVLSDSNILTKFRRDHLLWGRKIQVGYKKFAIFYQ